MLGSWDSCSGPGKGVPCAQPWSKRGMYVCVYILREFTYLLFFFFLIYICLRQYFVQYASHLIFYFFIWGITIPMMLLLSAYFKQRLSTFSRKWTNLFPFSLAYSLLLPPFLLLTLISFLCYFHYSPFIPIFCKNSNSNKYLSFYFWYFE